MLRFMERSESDRVHDIHRRAVAYYGEPGKDDPAERAEEIYHRLALGESGSTVETRWLPGVERYLYSALEDLPPAPRSWLATQLHVELTDAERREAPLEVWELDAVRRARQLLALGQFDAARGVVRERNDRSIPAQSITLKPRCWPRRDDTTMRSSCSTTGSRARLRPEAMPCVSTCSSLPPQSR